MTQLELQALVVAEAIQALEEVPSGHLYARVMAHMTYDRYESVIGVLIAAKLVTRRNHLLTWVGPQRKEA